MRDKIRILHIMNGAGLGGISTVVLNYYKMINREKYRFDFIMYNSKLGPNGVELKQLGCEMYFVPLKSKRLVKYIKEVGKIIKNGRYDVIHVHNGKTAYVALIIAKTLGVPIRIAHTHTASQSSGVIAKIRDNIAHFLNPKVATVLLACSNDAAREAFGESPEAIRKIYILKNAIDANKFRFDNKIRNKVRKDLGIDNDLVIGTVGNLLPVKNHKYLLEIFSALYSMEKKVKLVIVGEGPLLTELKAYTVKLNIADKVLFLGRRTDVNHLLMGFDIFVMPSLNEGFAIAALEAAASGLPIYLSNKIPRELQFYTRSKYLAIDVSPDIWAEELLSYSFDYDRLKGVSEVIENGFDIRQNVKQLEAIYENCLF